MDEDVRKLFADMRAMATLKRKNARDARRSEIYRLIELVHIETTTRIGETLLFKAAEGGDEELVRHLMNKGADIEGNHHRTPLMAASSKGHVEIMTILLDAGANLHASRYDGNALNYAMKEGTVEAARLLLTKGLKTCGNNHGLTTPLDLAASLGRHDMLLLVFEHFADISAANEHGRNALYYAAAARVNDASASLAVLLDHGATIDQLSRGGNTALHCAISAGNTQCVLLLLSRGASAAFADSNGLTALHKAVDRFVAVKVEIVAALLAHGALVGAVDGKGKTPLHHLVGGNDEFQIFGGRFLDNAVPAARELLQAGANVNATDAQGDTAFHIMAGNQYYDYLSIPQALAQLLIDHGADVAAPNNAGGRPSEVTEDDESRTFLLAAEEAQKNNHRYKRPRLEDLQPPAAAAAGQEEEEVDESEDESEDEDEDD